MLIVYFKIFIISLCIEKLMESGVKLGKYKVVKILGKGGFANVLLVRDQKNITYALK